MSNFATGLKSLFNDIGFGKKAESDPYKISIVESYTSEIQTLENIESYYKTITKISSIAKSIFEIAQPIASSEWKIKDTIKEKIVDNIPDALDKIIKRPGTKYDFKEFVNLLVTDLLVAGNIWVYRLQDGRGISLQRVDPKFVEYFDGYWIYRPPTATPFVLDDKYLTHIKLFPDPYDPLWGKGIIANNANLILSALRMLEFREKFYKNGCFPGGVFGVENNGSGMIDYNTIKKQIEARHQGSRDANKPLILDGKIKYHQTQLDPTGLKVTEELNILEKQIMSAFGLPRYLQEIGARDSGQKYNNHALQQEHFLKSTIIPISKKISDVFNSVVKLFSESWEFVFDINAEVYEPSQLQAMLENGAITRNEYRQMMALPKSDDDNLDVHLVPAGLQTIEQAIEGMSAIDLMPDANPTSQPAAPQQAQPTQLPEPKPKEPKPVPSSKPKVPNGKPRTKTWRDDKYLSMPAGDVWEVDEIKAEINLKRIRQDFITLNRKTREKKSKEQIPKMQGYFIETYGIILSNVAKVASEIDALSKPQKKADDKGIEKIISSVYSKDDDIKRIEKITLPLYHGVGEATYSNTSNILTLDLAFVINEPKIAGHLNLLRKSGPLVTDTTKGKLTEVISSGIEAGKTHNEIAKDIWLRFVDEDNDLVDEFSKIYRPGVKPKDFDSVMSKGGKLQNRAVLVARAEVAHANKRFAVQSMKDSGIIKSVMLTDCTPTELCAPHQNVPHALDDIDVISNTQPNCTGSIVPAEIEV